jgi:ribosomal protein S27AE
LDCQTTGSLEDFQHTNKCCKNCGKRNLEIKLGDDEYAYGPLAGIHFTTKACPKCGKLKDVEIHHLPSSLGMSEKEIKNSMRKESKEEYCHSLSHKPWF